LDVLNSFATKNLIKEAISDGFMAHSRVFRGMGGEF